MPPLDSSQYCDFWTSVVDLRFQIELAPKAEEPSCELQARKLDDELVRLEMAVTSAKAKPKIPLFGLDFWTSTVNARFQVELAPKSGQAPELQAQRLADEFLRLDNAVVLAKKRRNMLSAAYRLPAEVLSTVFVATRDVCHPYMKKKAKHFDLGYIGLSHVCGQWRAIALSTPRLWTYIHWLDEGLPSSLGKEMYQRSKGLPLDFRLLGYCSIPNASTWLHPSILSRISSLEIDEFPERDFEKLVLRRLKPGLPGLKELRLGTEDYCTVPSHIYNGASLSVLRLYNCAVAWNAPVFGANLTDLKLTLLGLDEDLPESFQPTFAQLAAVFTSATALQRVVFQNVFPTGSRDSVLPLILPETCCFAKVDALCRQMECLRMLANLVVPSGCTVDVAIWDRDDSSDEDMPYSYADVDDSDSSGSYYSDSSDYADDDTIWDDEYARWEEYDRDEYQGTDEYENAYWSRVRRDDAREESKAEARERHEWEREQSAKRRAEKRFGETQDVLGKALSNLLSTGHASGCLPFKELIVSIDGLSFHNEELPRTEWATFGGYTATVPQCARDRFGSTYFNIVGHCSIYSEPDDDLKLSCTAFSLPLQGLRAISFARAAAMDISEKFHHDGWGRLASATSVRRLGIDVGGGAALLKALAEVQRDPQPSFRMLPLLEVIHIHVGAREDKPMALSDTEASALLKLIKIRHRYGCSVKELVVEGSVAAWKIWNSFRPLVPVTACDFHRVAMKVCSDRSFDN